MASQPGNIRDTRERQAIRKQRGGSAFIERAVRESGPGEPRACEDVFAALQRLAANDLDKPQGTLVYTQLCNERGGIEADLTFVRLDENRFYMVTGSAFGVRDMGWIARHLPTDGSVAVQDVTSARATINLAGPLSRTILQEVAEGDVAALAGVRAVVADDDPEVRALFARGIAASTRRRRCRR